MPCARCCNTTDIERLRSAVQLAQRADSCCEHQGVYEKLKAAGEGGKMLRLPVAAGIEVWTDPWNEAVQSPGASLWPAARILSRHMLQTADALSGEGCAVLELGAGTGAVSLALAAKGRCSVTLTDVSRTLPLIQLNVAYNARRLKTHGQTIRAHVLPLHWGNRAEAAAALQCASPSGFDIVVGADCAYDNEQHEPLLSTLTAVALGSHEGSVQQRTRAVLALPDRGDGAIDSFIERSRRAGWAWETVTVITAENCRREKARLLRTIRVRAQAAAAHNRLRLWLARGQTATSTATLQSNISYMRSALFGPRAAAEDLDVHVLEGRQINQRNMVPPLPTQ